MGRKIRLWVCPCCKAAYSRKKYYPVCPYDPCPLCGIPYRKAIKYPDPNYYNYICKHRRKRTAAAKFKKEYYRKPRNLGGQVLKISGDTLKAFRSLYKAKRVDSFERRSNIFLKLLYKDMNNYPDDSYRKYVDDDCNIKKVQGGVAMVPELKIIESSVCLLSHIYNRSGFINIFQFRLGIGSYRSYKKDDLYRDFFYLISDWICSLIGISHKNYRLEWYQWFIKKLNIYGGVN